MSQNTATVIGVGRVGLPLALFLADQGLVVHGLDVDQTKITLIKSGQMPFLEQDAPPLLKKHLHQRFFPTTETEVVKDSQVVILTLGTPIDENMNPVLDQIDSVFEKIYPYLTRGQLIILRSTVSPTTTEYLKEEIETHTQLKVGKSIYLAFCPERIAEGKSLAETKTIPQIVGGFDPASTQQAVKFFTALGIECLPTDARSAELAKLFTNMYRYISFAIANEFMVIADKYQRNIHQITSLVNTKYRRGGLALPGLTAGPCLFKDGFFLINDSPYLDLITASWKINESIPLFLVNKLKAVTNLKNTTVAILGLSFKPEIDDIRESLSFKLRKALKREHAQVLLHDPYVTQYSRQVIEPDLNRVVSQSQVVIIAMRHDYYQKELPALLAQADPQTVVCDVWRLCGLNQLVFTADALR